MKNVVLLFAVVLTVFGCSEDNDAPPINLVPENLYSRHISTFYTEGTLRGKSLAVIKPEVRFTDNAEFKKDCVSQSGGQYTSLSYKQDNNYIIEISTSLMNFNDIPFEAPILREMAHLVLNKAYEQNPFAVTTTGVSMINPMCQCNTGHLDWNYQREEVLNYIFK